MTADTRLFYSSLFGTCFDFFEFFYYMGAGSFRAGNRFGFFLGFVFDEGPRVAAFFAGIRFVDVSVCLEFAFRTGYRTAASDTRVIEVTLTVFFWTIQVEFHRACVFAFREFVAAIEFFALAALTDEQHARFAFRTFFVSFDRGFFRGKLVAVFIEIYDVVAFRVG